MTQQTLPFKYEEEKKEKNLTALSGLLLYLGLFKAMKLDLLINNHLEVKKNKQGYRDDQIILTLILLNLAGGESVSDISILERDEISNHRLRVFPPPATSQKLLDFYKCIDTLRTGRASI